VRGLCMRSRERGRPRPLCERPIDIPMRGLVPKGSMRISLSQGTLLRAGTPALPTLCSPFHRKRMIFAHSTPVTDRLPVLQIFKR